MQTLSLHLGAPFSAETSAAETSAAETSAAEIVTERYISKQFSNAEALLSYLQTGHVDCLILQSAPELSLLFAQLQQQAIFFPTVVVEFPPAADPVVALSAEPVAELAASYHAAVVRLVAQQMNQIGLAIDQAISRFIQLKPDGQLSTDTVPAPLTHGLMTQQIRLAEKLKERLDYLGVYYKRNPQNFLRHMTPAQKGELLRQLKLEYRNIILTYFSSQADLNERIDNFVNVGFFADVPIAQIVEIHMDLMDEFSKQLKLEGRSDEVLLDYRLTLIDTLAHLCEMYRRSIPRES